MTPRIVILEDEAPARARLEQAIRRAAPGARIVAALDSVEAAVAYLQAHPAPDLILADIQLGDGLSFEVLDAVDVTAPVVFCTAYDEYVLDAFARSGIDYLLKPIDDAAVAAALAKYRRLEAHFADRVRAAARAMAPGGRRRLLVRRRGGLAAVAIDDVAYFQCEDKLVDVVTHDGARYAIDRTLGDLEAELDPDEFFRVNRQWLVCARAIDGVWPHGKGRLSVRLVPPARSEVIVSQENAARFRAWLGA